MEAAWVGSRRTRPKRRFLALLLPLVLLQGAGTGSAGPAPANDSFVNRLTIVLTNVEPFVLSSNLLVARNTSASKQMGEPDHAQNGGDRSVWWTWTAPLNGDVRITTDGSDFDTLLAVYTGTAVANLSGVVENDDHGAQVTSRVRFRASAGTAYQIAVDGFADLGGMRNRATFAFY